MCCIGDKVLILLDNVLAHGEEDEGMPPRTRIRGMHAGDWPEYSPESVCDVVHSNDAGPPSNAKECYTFHVLRPKCRLDLVLPMYTRADSSGCRPVGRKSGWSPPAGVDFPSSVELQPPEILLLVVACPWLGALIWSTSMGGASFFVSTSFHSSVGSSIIDACTRPWSRGDVSP
ncbi:hypothetical protein GW17_00025746 [Ensete ventricosum]|nr:hypothetical protein GW17_00025746 [Ensete ventricosum]RZS24612.1 hypothetical protein BHM03_00057701 [Ensete ventricosum]